jgi:hypothetical protein
MNKLYEIKYFYDDKNYSKPPRKVYAPNELIAEKLAKRSKTFFVRLEITEIKQKIEKIPDYEE